MPKCLVLLALVLLCACQATASAGPLATVSVTGTSPDPFMASTLTPAPVLISTLTETVQPPDSAEQLAWSSSPHALPALAATPAANPPAPADLASAAVPCSDCHANAAGLVVGSGIAWWDTSSQQYQAVADVSALCLKCHQQQRHVDQANASQGAMHGGFQCTACHDPHTTVASCSSSSCHQNILLTNDMPPSTPTGGHPFIGGGGPFCGGSSCHPAATAAASQPRSVHGAAHINVTCQACHAAGDLKAAPGKDGGRWVTWQTVAQSGSSAEVPYFPHDIQLQVDCQRCHFAGNPWALPLVTGNEFQK